MGAVRTPGVRSWPSGSASGWPSANASSPPCAVSFVRSALRTHGWSVPPPGSPIGAGVRVRCGGLCSPSAPTAGASRRSWVGGVGGSAPSSAGGGAPRAWPPATGGGSGRLPGSAGCRASAKAAVRGRSGPGPGPGAGQPGDDGSAGRAGIQVGGAWCRWGGGGGVGRGSGVCPCGEVICRRVRWVRCRPVRCAMVRAGFWVGRCCCRLAGCRPWAVRWRDGWC